MMKYHGQDKSYIKELIRDLHFRGLESINIVSGSMADRQAGMYLKQ